MAKSNKTPAAKTAAAPAPKATAAPATEAKVPVAKMRGPRGVLETAVITVLSDGNPKRPGSRAHEVFALYKSGMTVGAFVDATEKAGEAHRAYATPCMVYDAAHGFIKIEGYDPGPLKEAKVAKPKAEKAAAAPKAKKAAAAPKAAAQADAEAEEETID